MINPAITDPIATLLGAWSTGLGTASVFFRIVVSVVLSAIIGCERSSKRHSAGFRTFILVSLASTTAMLIDIYLAESFGFKLPMLSVASVIAVAITSGNSVLFSSRNQIKGLTTSVGLWACGFIGLAIGAGLYLLTIVSFSALLCSLMFFPQVENLLKNISNHFDIHLELKNRDDLKEFVATIRKLGLRIDDIEMNPAYLNSGLSVYTIGLTIDSPELKKYKKHSEIIEALSSLEYIYHIEELI